MKGTDGCQGDFHNITDHWLDYTRKTRAHTHTEAEETRWLSREALTLIYNQKGPTIIYYSAFIRTAPDHHMLARKWRKESLVSPAGV